MVTFLLFIKSTENSWADWRGLPSLIVGIDLRNSIPGITPSEILSLLVISKSIAGAFLSRLRYNLLNSGLRCIFWTSYGSRVWWNSCVANHWPVWWNFIPRSEMYGNVRCTAIWSLLLAWNTRLWYICTRRNIAVILKCTFSGSWIIQATIAWVPRATWIITTEVHYSVCPGPITTTSLNLLNSSVCILKFFL